MSITTLYNLDNPANFIFDSNKIQISSGKASLKLINNPGQDFVENFDSGAGFIYDSDKAEFAGGQVQQKNKRVANAIFGATYTNNVNGSWGDGVLTGIPSGGAGVSGGKLDLSFGDVRYVDYDANSNADSQQVGTIRFKITPNYSGTPSTNQYLFVISKDDLSVNNLMNVYHNSGNGYISYTLYNSAGGLAVAGALANWNPTAGVEYEFCFCFDFTTGASRVFIDGVQKGSTIATTFTRDGDINLFRVGSNRLATFSSNFKIDDLVYYDISLFQSNYVPGYSIEETDYLTSNVTLPEMEYTGVGTLISFDSFITSETDAPRYTLQIGRSGNYLYWNGAIWTTSDGTYSQANDLTTFAANLGTLPVFGEIYGQFKIHFTDSNIQSAVSQLTASLTAQIYPTDNPTIEPAGVLGIESLDDFAEVATKPGSNDIRYTLKKNGDYYYHDGADWVVSDGTYAQTNSITEILTNKSTFTTTQISFKWKAFLHSGDGSETPDLTSISVTYDFFGVVDDLEKCIVWGYNINSDCSPNSNKIEIKPSRNVVKYKNTVVVLDEIITVIPNSNTGYWEVELLENENMDGDTFYFFIFGSDRLAKIVPNEQEKNIWELVDH